MSASCSGVTRPLKRWRRDRAAVGSLMSLRIAGVRTLSGRRLLSGREAERQAHRAVDTHGWPPDSRIVEGEVVKPGGEDREGFLHLGSGQRGAEAVVDATSEGQLCRPRGGDVERGALAEDGRLPLGGGQEKTQVRPGGDVE